MAVRQAAERLAEILGVPDLAENARLDVRIDDDHAWDAVLTLRGHSFVLEWKRAGSLGLVARGIDQLQMAHISFKHEVIPVLAVPTWEKQRRSVARKPNFRGLISQEMRESLRLASFIRTWGIPTYSAGPGRPESAFGPRGSRIARRLLMEPAGPVRQRTLAYNTGLSEGHASRIVGKLLEAGLVERGEHGVRVTDLDTLLNAWREEYRFDRHHVIQGHIAAGGGDSLIHSIAGALSRVKMLYAATALPAAWLWTRHAGFRLSTIYLPAPPSPGLKRGPRFPGGTSRSQHLAGSAKTTRASSTELSLSTAYAASIPCRPMSI